MNKKTYSSPEIELVSFRLTDVLGGSIIPVVDPEVPTEVGGIGEEDEL